MSEPRHIPYEPAEGPVCEYCGDAIAWPPTRVHAAEVALRPLLCARCVALEGAVSDVLSYVRIAPDRETRDTIFELLDSRLGEFFK